MRPLASRVTIVLLSLVADAVCVAAPPAAPRVCAEALADCQRGQALIARNDARAAERALTAATRLADEWSEPHALLALLYQSQGDEDRARRHYARVQDLSLGPVSENEATGQLGRQNLAAMEGYLCLLINHDRRQAGLTALVADPKLACIAREHSDEMRDMGYFSHASPPGGAGDVLARFLRAFGDQPPLLGENVARRRGAASRLNEFKIADSHRGLMESPGHRANIMEPSIRRLGIGISAQADGDGEAYWITEVFLKPRHEEIGLE